MVCSKTNFPSRADRIHGSVALYAFGPAAPKVAHPCRAPWCSPCVETLKQIVAPVPDFETSRNKKLSFRPLFRVYSHFCEIAFFAAHPLGYQESAGVAFVFPRLYEAVSSSVHDKLAFTDSCISFCVCLFVFFIVLARHPIFFPRFCLFTQSLICISGVLSKQSSCLFCMYMK